MIAILIKTEEEIRRLENKELVIARDRGHGFPYTTFCTTCNKNRLFRVLVESSYDLAICIACDSNISID